jgi:hypothetical protein
MWVRELRTAAWGENWPRALLFAEECPAVGERLAEAEGLSEVEKTNLRLGVDNVRLLTAFIRAERSHNEPCGLDRAQAAAIDELAGLLERIGGRLHHEPTRGATP